MEVDASGVNVAPKANFWETRPAVSAWTQTVVSVSLFRLKCSRVPSNFVDSSLFFFDGAMKNEFFRLYKNKTPLETLEIINVPNGKLLATPYLYDENKESGNRCFYTGVNNGDALWTDRCGNLDNPWHVWEFRAVNGNQNRFQLVHKVTGRCAKIVSNASNSDVNSLPCTTDSSMIWSWVDGV